MSVFQTFNASTLRKKAVFGIILTVFCGSALALQKAELFAVTEMKWPWEDEFGGCTRKPVDVFPFSMKLLVSLVVLGSVFLILDRICVLPSNKKYILVEGMKIIIQCSKVSKPREPIVPRPFFSRFSTRK